MGRIRVMPKLLQRLIRDETGATAIEYGMIASLVAIVIIASLRLVGSRLAAKFTAIAGNLN